MTRLQKHDPLKAVVAQFEKRQISRREFARLSTLLGLSASAAYVAAGLPNPLTESAARAAASSGTVRISMRIHEIDKPHIFSWAEPSNVVRQVCGYLTQTGQDNITRPSLLESWQPSPDLRSWTLVLRKNVTWHKGGTLVSDQVIWNLMDCLDEKTGSSVIGLMQSYMLKEVDKGEKDDKGKPKKSLVLWDDNAIEKIDDHTIRLNLSTPQISIPEDLFHYPLAILDPQEGGKFGVGSNGTGAFELVEFNAGHKAVLKARTEHWNRVPAIETLEFIDLGDDPAATVASFASDQIDGAFEVDITQDSALRKMDQLKLYQVVTAQTAVVHGKTTRKPFDDPKVRLAMRLAINQDVILQLSQGDHGVIGEHHHVCPIHPEYAKLPPFVQDIPKAKALLAEAGYPDGFDTTLTLPADPKWQSIAAQGMVQQWAKAGIRVKLAVVPAAQWWDVWDKVDLGYTVWYHRPLATMTLSLAYRSNAPWNAPEWSDKEFDDLLTQAQGTIDVEARRDIMKKIEIIMQERGPIVQPFWRSIFTFYNKRVSGFKMHPTSFIFGEELSVAG